MGDAKPRRQRRALIVEMRNLRFAQPGVWLQIGIETGERLIGVIAVPADCGTRESRWPKIPKFPPEMSTWIAARLATPVDSWVEYGTRWETRQAHGRELRTYLGMSACGIADFRQYVEHVGEVAAQTDKRIVLHDAARDFLQSRKVASPGIGIINRA